jgi:hypothetical protein
MKVDWLKPHSFISLRHGPRGFCGAEGVFCIMFLATSETALTLVIATASSGCEHVNSRRGGASADR